MSVDKKERAVSHEILVVDDAPASLQLLTRILSDHGYRVRPASSGLLALRSVEAKAPDLILLDIKMPDLDGFEVCRRLKGDERSRDIPVLFISGLNESADKVKGFAVGGLDYIVKPFTAEEVLARVGIHLRLHDLTEHLEREVSARTEELTAANRQLQQEIEERKNVESALIDSNERFLAFMSYAPFYAYVKDATLKHLFANKKTMDLFPGFRSEEVVSGDFFGAELAKKLGEADRRILDGDSDFEELEYLVTIAGKDVWLKDIKFPIVLADGTRLVGGVAVDITERMRSVEEIRKASRAWITAMDASGDIIYLLDLERRVMRANKPFFMITRSTPESAIGRHIVELVHPEGEKVPCPVCVAQEEKRDFSFIMEPDHPDNPAGLPIEITLRIVRDDEGRPLSMLMTLHDLTQDRKVQEELAKYREHLEELVKARTTEIEQQKSELERLNKLFVGRELKMIELKEQIRELENQKGEPGNESGHDA